MSNLDLTQDWVLMQNVTQEQWGSASEDVKRRMITEGQPIKKQPDTELAVDTITNPVIYTATKDDKLLVAFSKPSIGFILDERGAENLIKALQKKLKTIRRYRQGKR